MTVEGEVPGAGNSLPELSPILAIFSRMELDKHENKT